MTREMFEEIYSHACPILSEELAYEYPIIEESKYELILLKLAKRDIDFHITLREMFPETLKQLCEYAKNID